MSIKEDIRPVDLLKTRAGELLAQVASTHRPVVLVENGEAKGVLQDVESYEQTQQALGLLKLVAQGEEDVRAGRIVPQAEVFDGLKQQMNTRGRKDG